MKILKKIVLVNIELFFKKKKKKKEKRKKGKEKLEGRGV